MWMEVHIYGVKAKSQQVTYESKIGWMAAARDCKMLRILPENSAGESFAGVTYLSMRINPKSCHIFPLKVSVTLLNGSRKGADGRVWIIALYFANCRMNSSYCDCKVINHAKNAKQFFPQGKLNSSTLYFSTSHPHFIHLLHTIIKIIIAYRQIYITKCKKCFTIVKSLATFCIFMAKWISNDNLTTGWSIIVT